VYFNFYLLIFLFLFFQRIFTAWFLFSEFLINNI
jgi:hypothetical protein